MEGGGRGLRKILPVLHLPFLGLKIAFNCRRSEHIILWLVKDYLRFMPPKKLVISHLVFDLSCESEYCWKH